MSQCKYSCGRSAEAGRSRCRTCRRGDKLAVALSGPRVLMLDIETSPNLAYVWGLWDQNVGLNQLEAATEMMCFAAKWLGDKGTMFHRGEGMVETAHDLLDGADVVMHFNGKRFDVPHLNREFLLAGLTPPSPYKQIDLLSVVKQRFRFPSNKLAYVSKVLGLEGKVEHEGFELWRKCMAGDAAAWKRMEAYNRQDVELLEELYHILLPWIPGHPHRHLYGGRGDCPTCGGSDVRPAGYYRTKMSSFRQYQCQGCGSFFRSTRREQGVTLTEAVA